MPFTLTGSVSGRQLSWTKKTRELVEEAFDAALQSILHKGYCVQLDGGALTVYKPLGVVVGEFTLSEDGEVIPRASNPSPRSSVKRKKKASC